MDPSKPQPKAFMNALSTISIDGLPEIELERCGWIMGYAVSRGAHPVVMPNGYPSAMSCFYFTPQSEPDVADLEWKTTITVLSRAPLGALARIDCARAGKGMFGSGGASYLGYVHIQGDRIMGASLDSYSAASFAESDHGLMARALEAMDAQGLENLARAALSRAEAIRARERAGQNADDALERMRGELRGSR